MKLVNDRKEFLLALWGIPHFNIDAVEIGVFRGDFSQMIWDILQPHNMTLIDPFKVNEEKYKSGLTTSYSTEEDYQLVIKRFENEIKEKRITVNRRYSFDAFEHYSDDCFDFIYLDGSHLYKDVKRDLVNWVYKLSVDGSLCGHDYIDDPDFGVKQAVDEFCKEYNCEMFLLNEKGGDFALRLI